MTASSHDTHKEQELVIASSKLCSFYDFDNDVLRLRIRNLGSSSGRSIIIGL